MAIATGFGHRCGVGRWRFGKPAKSLAGQSAPKDIFFLR